MILIIFKLREMREDFRFGSSGTHYQTDSVSIVNVKYIFIIATDEFYKIIDFVKIS